MSILKIAKSNVNGIIKRPLRLPYYSSFLDSKKLPVSLKTLLDEGYGSHRGTDIFFVSLLSTDMDLLYKNKEHAISLLEVLENNPLARRAYMLTDVIDTCKVFIEADNCPLKLKVELSAKNPKRTKYFQKFLRPIVEY